MSAEDEALSAMISKYYRVRDKYISHKQKALEFTEIAKEYDELAKRYKDRALELAKWIDEHDSRKYVEWEESALEVMSWARMESCTLCGQMRHFHFLASGKCKDEIWCKSKREDR